jgi:hypothetical protein
MGQPFEKLLRRCQSIWCSPDQYLLPVVVTRAQRLGVKITFLDGYPDVKTQASTTL